MLELSGPASVFVRSQRESIEMALDDLNARRAPGERVALVVYDNESNETKSLVLAKRLVEQDGVVGIVGAGTTPTTMPLVPYVMRAGVPLVSTGSGDVIVTPSEQRRWVFKTAPNASDVAAKVVRLLVARRLSPVAFLSVNNAYGDSGRREFEKLAGPAGVRVSTWDRFGATDTDVKPQLTRARSSGARAIVVWAIPPAATIVAKNAAELSLPGELQMVHDHGAGIAPAFLELAGGAAEGTILVTAKLPVAEQLPDTDPQKPVLLAYATAYRQRTGQGASAVGGMAYDAMVLFRKALEAAGPDRAGIRDAIERTSGLVGVSGVFRMSPTDHVGIHADDLELARVERGKLVRITA